MAMVAFRSWLWWLLGHGYGGFLVMAMVAFRSWLWWIFGHGYGGF